jgi:HlyD family secretion protein
MKIRQLYKVILILFFLSLSLLSCGKKESETDKRTKDLQTFVVTPKSSTTNLYFSGTLNPISIINVVTPVEGIVVEKKFDYGQRVNKSDLLFKIDSEKVESNFNAALAEFLSAKDKLLDARIRFEGTKALAKVGEASGDEIRQDESTFNNANITYLQARYKFEEAARLSPENIETLEKLKLSDIEAVKHYLMTKYNFFDIKATADGVALAPPKMGSTESNEIVVGSSVKQNQVLVSIGNLDGLSVTITINEIDINKVKSGQDATITGVGFPKETLKGIVQEVASQAHAVQGAVGGLPTFNATVIVPSLTPNQKKLIRVGMSAKISIMIKHPDTILIPIDAVTPKHGRSYVNRLVNGKIQETEVSTGETTLNDVEITKGLNAGDKILYKARDIVVPGND